MNHHITRRLAACLLAATALLYCVPSVIRKALVMQAHQVEIVEAK